MVTTGTSLFNMDVNDLLEEAFERAGAELRSGYDFRTARRSLNLLSIEWANRGINLWTVEEGAIPLLRGVKTYALPVDTIDLIQHVIRTGEAVNQSDLTINRISVDTYASIPNKNTEGRPIQVYINRQGGEVRPDLRVNPPTVTVWPVPNQDDWFTLVYWRLRRMQDAGDGTNTQDIPFRFLPAMVAGLAYHIALKIPDALDRLQILKTVYDEQWMLASDEDREKAPLNIPPHIYPV